jgi:L-lactate dehydrogenase complex protein LldG
MAPSGAVVTTRAAFLEGIRREMARTSGLFPATPSPRPAAPLHEAAAIRSRARRATEALLARFGLEAEQVGTVVHRAATVEEASATVLRLAAAREARRVATWRRSRLGPLSAVATRLAEAGLDVYDGAPENDAGAGTTAPLARLAVTEIGLTGVDLAVAETGSLILASGVGKGRAVSLLPPCHVALLGPDQLVESLEEAAVILEAWNAAELGTTGSNIVFVTGPSRTADIELTLTRGVHGPREVHAVFVDALSSG